MLHKQHLVTPEGLIELQAELDYLREIRLPQVLDRIRQAKGASSTVDDGGYNDAGIERGLAMARISTLENIIKHAIVIDRDEIPEGVVGFGSRVTVCNEDGKAEAYQIVGSVEANPSKGRISNESPVGRALLGKKVGEEVMVTAPSGDRKLVITDVG